MNSKLTTLISVLCSGLTLSTCDASSDYFVLGFTGGYTAARSNLHTTLLYVEPSAPFLGIPQSDVLTPFSDSSYQWGFLAGYQFIYHCWLMGGEINLLWENYTKNHDFAFSDPSAAAGGNGLGWVARYRYQRDVSIEFALRLGYEIIPTVNFLPAVTPYIRLGVDTSKDIIEATYNSDPRVYIYSATSTFRRWPYRLLAGIGTEFPLNSHLALRFEYNYHSSAQNLETKCTILDGQILTPYFTTAINPIIQTGKMSIVWNFK